MDKPTIADNKPKKVELVQNEEYMFCTCGKSKNQPFCDWSHAGIATQKPELRKKLNIDESSARLTRFFNASVDLMKILARACGHDHLNKLSINDLITWKKEMSELSGVSFGGIINNKQNNK